MSAFRITDRRWSAITERQSWSCAVGDAIAVLIAIAVIAQSTEVFAEACIRVTFAKIANFASVRSAVTIFVAFTEDAAFIAAIKLAWTGFDAIAIIVTLTVFAQAASLHAVTIGIAVTKVALLTFARQTIAVGITLAQVAAFVAFSNSSFRCTPNTCVFSSNLLE